VAVYLTEQDVERLLGPADGVEAVEASFRRLAAGTARNRPRYRIPFAGGTLQVMAAVDEEAGLAGSKTYAVAGGEMDVIVSLFSIASGKLAGVIEANKLGQLRTGGASAVAARHLARPGASSLGVIGCGRQAESQVACIRETIPSIERVVAYCRTEHSLRTFCERVHAVAGDSNQAAAEQDIVVTVTSSRDPVLRGEWLREGALVCAVGANHPSRRELDNVALERAAFVCCDSLEQTQLESADLIEPVETGTLDWLEVHELQQVVSGQLPGRQAEADIVVFKSNGLAAWDVALGAVALGRA
jgi:ornithine cyclodeaminase/alanine dehydrogenase-like protein (mu-crystallin family)